MYIILKYFISCIRRGMSNVIIDKILKISLGEKKSLRNSGTLSSAFTSKALVINLSNLTNFKGGQKYLNFILRKQIMNYLCTAKSSLTSFLGLTAKIDFSS